MKTEITGNIIVVGNNIDTDQIYPAAFWLSPIRRRSEVTACAAWMRTLPQNFPQGGIVVAGNNFGCGSSRSMRLSRC